MRPSNTSVDGPPVPEEVGGNVQLLQGKASGALTNLALEHSQGEVRKERQAFGTFSLALQIQQQWSNEGSILVESAYEEAVI